MNTKCQEETVLARAVRDQKQEKVRARDAVAELEPVVSVEWAEQKQEQDQTDSVSVHRAARQRHIRSVSHATSASVPNAAQ